MRAEFHLSSQTCECTCRDELSAALGESAFIGLGEGFIKPFGECELENGVTEKFESFVIELILLARVVIHAAVSEGLGQQRGIRKIVADDGLHSSEAGRHGFAPI